MYIFDYSIMANIANFCQTAIAIQGIDDKISKYKPQRESDLYKEIRS